MLRLRSLCYLCVIFVLSVYYLCVIFVLSVYYLCVIFVLPVYYLCVIFVLSVYYLCVIFVLSVYYLCTESLTAQHSAIDICVHSQSSEEIRESESKEEARARAVR